MSHVLSFENSFEVEFNEDFRFFLTTRKSNPHYSPEVCVKTLVVNFSVKLKGLEDQLLGKNHNN